MKNPHIEETQRLKPSTQKSIFLDQELQLKACRICLENEVDTTKQIITPCKCKGSTGFVHEQCLKTWIVTQTKQFSTVCEICKFEYNIQIKKRKVCMPRKVCKANVENLLALICLTFVFSGFTVLQVFIIIQITNIYNGDESGSSILTSPITMIGISVLIFICLIPIFYCLVYILVKMLFITKIKSWHILDRPQTPINNEEAIHQSILSRQSHQHRATELLNQVPRITQTTEILIQPRQEYEHIQYI
ncbi:hypothetical protein pb186bvf_009506 [Paramecium bursaria]